MVRSVGDEVIAVVVDDSRRWSVELVTCAALPFPLASTSTRGRAELDAVVQDVSNQVAASRENTGATREPRGSFVKFEMKAGSPERRSGHALC